MNKKVIVIAALIVAGLAGLFWWGSRGDTGTVSQNTGPISSLAALEKMYDFGTISMKNGVVSHAFKVTNSSDKDVYVKRLFTSCMCTSAYLESPDGEKGPFGMEGMGYVPPVDETIKAGESRDIKVVFDPNAHGPAGVGAIDRVISLTDASGAALEIQIKAVVTP